MGKPASTFSLFDLLSFLIPGCLLEFFVFVSYKLSGIIIQFPDIDFLKKDLVATTTLIVLGYVLGHVLFYLNEFIPIIGLNAMRKRSAFDVFLKKNSTLVPNLNEIAKKQFGLSFLNPDIDKKVLDNFFNLSFRVLDGREKLSVVLGYQGQFFLFSNLCLTFFVGFILLLASLIVLLSKHTEDNYFYLLIGSKIVCVVFIFIFYKIALSRRRRFLETFWMVVYDQLKP